VAEPNDALRRARENAESPHASGDCLSRQELAELVNDWLFEHTENHQVSNWRQTISANWSRAGSTGHRT
jgi:hemerythrin